MKHNPKVIAIILCMFLVTQFLGLYVVNFYSTSKLVDGVKTEVSAPVIPFFDSTAMQSNPYSNLVSMIISFVFAILLILLLMRFNSALIMRIWFFSVVVLALSVTLNCFFSKLSFAIYLAVLIALPLAYYKIFKRNILVHNFTELLIYPGVAAVFVLMLNWVAVLILLVIISIYDMWAVWKSGIMQRMAKYQIKELKIFSGFLIPHLSKAQKELVAKLSKDQLKKKKFKMNVAILGGGDVIFPIIVAGAFMKSFGLISAIFVLIGATLGLCYIFAFGEKKKPYPAMPYISTGIFAALIIWALISYLF